MQALTRDSGSHDPVRRSHAGAGQIGWFPEAQLLIFCARTVVSDRTRTRIASLLEQPLNWPLVLDLARFHGVGPLVYRTLRSCGGDHVPEEPMDALRRETQAGMLLNQVLSAELVQLCAAFEAQGVPVVPFKGATLAAMAYKDSSLRDFDDLDFIVPQHRLTDAQRVLWSQGYRPRDRSHDEQDAAHADGPYHVFVKRNSLLRVDLQWVMAHEQFSFRLDRPEVWRHLAPISVNGKQVRGLSPEDLMIVLCVHGSKHAWERLKWVADVAELMRAQRLDWRRMFAAAAAWRCRRMMLLGLALAQRVMEAPLPPDILAELQEDQDVSDLAPRMPKNLLVNQRSGIDEHDGPALYLSLKDTRWDRWRYGLTLSRADHPVVLRPPVWFRFARSLRWTGRLVRMLRGSAAVRWLRKRLLLTVNRFRESPH